MNKGSVESLKVCVRCGASANARQIRETADYDMPMAAAIDRVDQWVALPTTNLRPRSLVDDLLEEQHGRGRRAAADAHRDGPRFAGQRRQDGGADADECGQQKHDGGALG